MINVIATCTTKVVFFLQGFMINTTIDGNYTLVESENLILNPRLNMFQSVYGSSLIIVTLLVLFKSIIYMKVSKLFLSHWLLCILFYVAMPSKLSTDYSLSFFTLLEHYV